IKDINFIWDEVLNFDGNTGPYVQYTYARCCGILEKAGEYGKGGVLTESAEYDIVKTLSLFPEKVEQARRELEPSVISRFLLDVCQEFNRFYHDCPVLKADSDEVKNTRLDIVKATGNVLKSGLALIGLKAPRNI
ncbi:MAG: arginine--tRNA ligase, partial [Clostridia bacterium]|nr:arginine--tRNA ligase [Clostridia bacterium]